MGKKEAKGKHYSFRSLFNSLNAHFLSFWRHDSNSYFNATLKKGFTLIELVVVLGVLAIFSSFIIASLNPIEQFNKASDSERKSDLAQIQRALEAYYHDFGKYPDQSVDYKIIHNAQTVDWGTAFSPYIEILPSDPKDSKTYVYVTDSTGQSYYIYASLERADNDLDTCFPDGSVCSNVPPGVNCGASFICNYGVSSPNVSP